MVLTVFFSRSKNLSHLLRGLDIISQGVSSLKVSAAVGIAKFLVKVNFLGLIFAHKLIYGLADLNPNVFLDFGANLINTSSNGFKLRHHSLKKKSLRVFSAGFVNL